MRKSWATSFLEIQCFIKCNLLLQVRANGHSVRPTQAAGCKQKSTDKMAEKGKGRKVKTLPTSESARALPFYSSESIVMLWE